MSAPDQQEMAAYPTDPGAANSGGAGRYVTDSQPSRSSRRGSETRARSQLINVRIDQDERERWTAFAQSKGLPLAGFVRLAVEAAIVQDEIVEAMR